MKTITIEFPTEDHAELFAEYMSDGGGEWGYKEALSHKGLAPVHLGYHGPEKTEFPRNDRRRYGPFMVDAKIRVELIEEEEA